VSVLSLSSFFKGRKLETLEGGGLTGERKRITTLNVVGVFTSTVADAEAPIV
jgi:hypothetical protein